MTSKIEAEALALQAFSEVVGKQNSITSLDSLLTRSEQITIGRRLLIAHGIIAGKTRAELTERLCVSPNTFAQVRRWVESEFSNYDSAHKRQPETRGDNHWVPPYSYEHFKRVYPGHFLLFSLAEKLFSDKN